VIKWRAALSLVGLSLSLAARAAAGELPQGPPPTVARAKPLLPMGLGLSLASAAHMIIGGALVGVGPHGDTVCGLTGCFERPRISLRVEGTALLAAGVGLGLVGGPVLIYGAVNDKKARGPRESEASVRAGLVMGAGGLALGGAGMMLMLQRKQLDHVSPYMGKLGFTTGTVLSIAGGILALGSIPFVLIGMEASKEPPQPPPQRLPPPLLPPPGRAPVPVPTTKPALGITGAVVTGFGVMLGVAGGAVAGTAPRGHGFSGLGETIAGIGLMVGGGAHILVGVPMIIAGLMRRAAPSPSPVAAGRPRFVPSLAVGPLSAHLRFDF